jgi:hypothetical protein
MTAKNGLVFLYLLLFRGQKVALILKLNIVKTQEKENFSLYMVKSLIVLYFLCLAPFLLLIKRRKVFYY